MTQLNGKVCFVTGGTSGIGKAATRKLLNKGAKVFVMSRTQETLDDLVREAVDNNQFNEDMEMGSHGWMVDYGTLWFTTYCYRSDLTNCYCKIIAINNGEFPDASVVTQTPQALLVDEDLYGVWIVVDIEDSYLRSNYNPHPFIDQYMGSYLIIEPGKIHFYGETCTFDALYHRLVIADDYMEIRTGATILGIGILNQVYVEIVETGCAGVPFRDIIVENEDRIYIQMGNYNDSSHFLELERVD